MFESSCPRRIPVQFAFHIIAWDLELSERSNGKRLGIFSRPRYQKGRRGASGPGPRETIKGGNGRVFGAPFMIMMAERGSGPGSGGTPETVRVKKVFAGPKGIFAAQSLKSKFPAGTQALLRGKPSAPTSPNGALRHPAPPPQLLLVFFHCLCVCAHFIAHLCQQELNCCQHIPFLLSCN